jgi:uncharacterized Zn finger protein (UPF0148 family)
MATEKHQCSKQIYSGITLNGRRCEINAKVERDGKWYCGIHDPVAVKAKRDAQEAKWRAECAAEKQQQQADEAAAAEKKRRADLFPWLLAVLELIVETDDRHELDHNHIEAARTMIAKAKGDAK